MSVDPVSLTVAILALASSIVGHIRYSKCGNCIEVEMADDNHHHIDHFANQYADNINKIKSSVT